MSRYGRKYSLKSRLLTESNSAQFQASLPARSTIAWAKNAELVRPASGFYGEIFAAFVLGRGLNKWQLQGQGTPSKQPSDLAGAPCEVKSGELTGGNFLLTGELTVSLADEIAGHETNPDAFLQNLKAAVDDAAFELRTSNPGIAGIRSTLTSHLESQWDSLYPDEAARPEFSAAAAEQYAATRIAKAYLGNNNHLCGVVRNGPNVTVYQWHFDDETLKNMAYNNIGGYGQSVRGGEAYTKRFGTKITLPIPLDESDQPMGTTKTQEEAYNYLASQPNVTPAALQKFKECCVVFG